MSAGRTAEVIHTRPCSSNIGLWTLFLLVQIGSSPQYADGWIIAGEVGGVAGSRTVSGTRRHGVPHRIQHRQVIGAEFERAVDQAVRVPRRIAPVGRDLVVQIGLRIGPVPLGDHDVPFDALRTRRRRRHFAGLDPIGPVREHRERALRPELVDAAHHVRPGLARHDPPLPPFERLHVLERRRAARASPSCPARWHDQHVPDFIVRSHSAWFFMFGEMPLPDGPVPGNSDLSGTLISENQ